MPELRAAARYRTGAKTRGKVRLDDNEIRISGARRVGITTSVSPLALPGSVGSGNLGLNNAVIRWMSGKGEGGRMKKSNIITGSRAKSCQLVVASLSILLGFVALPGPALAGLSGKITSPNASQQGGQVMPPSAMPFGFSLKDMAAKTAQFTTSGNSLPPPTTPFKILFGKPPLMFAVQGNGQGQTGLVETGMNSFRVSEGTMFYVPIANVDDSPPVAGTFPASSSTVASYWFDSSQLGGTDSIVVDGKTTSIGATYLVGPITTSPLQDGGGTHIITMGVFLTPLSKGSHTVSIRTLFNGAAIGPFLTALVGLPGLNFLQGEFIYTVIVQ
jgi:hypothetical protein